MNPDPCPCERCSPENPAPTYTRKHLIACLAREIAAEDGLERRRARLEAWANRHDRASTNELRAAVKVAWEGRG
jgi:hypothetical protein